MERTLAFCSRLLSGLQHIPRTNPHPQYCITPGTEQPTDGLVKEHITDEVRRSPRRRRAVLVLLVMTLRSSLLYHFDSEVVRVERCGQKHFGAD